MPYKIILFSISCLMMATGPMPAAHAAAIGYGKLQVKVNIGSACELKSGDKSVLDFGPLSDLNDKNHDAQTATGSGIEVLCSKGINYSLGLTAGLHENTANKHRQMSNGKEFVDYLLFQDSTYTTGWQDIDTPFNYIRAVSDGNAKIYPVYGRIEKQKTPVSGSYTDTVTVQLSF